MLGKDLIKEMTVADLDRELIVTETKIIRAEVETDCKDGVCNINFNTEDNK